MIKIIPLGAGQDVGRSCILISIGDDSTGIKNLMFDCGMHMGYNDERRFPDFSYISKTNRFTEQLDCIIVSHFHLDHCGALPYFTEMCGYEGPIFMTHPTKAICPILLEDYRKITVERKGETNFFTSQMIKDCMKKVTAVNLHQTIKVNGDDDLEIKAFYAGHVLGAAMFYVRVGTQSVVYTGDYNMTPDRHLGAAWIDKVRPDLLITESTYATTIRDSKRTRERDFLKKVHDCVTQGGKVLIPVFALGRAQELCILIETYWERNNLNVPVYFSAGMTEKANDYYKLFINWTNEKIKNTFVQRNMFDFKHIKPWDRQYLDLPGPAVLFATPGMLHIGTSLEVFKKWAPYPENMVIMPGYCVAGTVGAKVLNGDKEIYIDAYNKINVKLQVKNLSFSAHADAKGILQLIKQCDPKNVMLVHGEKAKMEFLQEKIKRECRIPCYSPANGETTIIDTPLSIPVDVSVDLLKRHLTAQKLPLPTSDDKIDITKIKPVNGIPIQGILTMEPDQIPKLMDVNEAIRDTNLPLRELTFEFIKSFDPNKIDTSTRTDIRTQALENVYEKVRKALKDDVNEVEIIKNSSQIKIRSMLIRISDKNSNSFNISWNYKDENLANYVMSIIDNILPE
ncbi:integrator complex subunit 11 [Rhizophagus irregularis]|uniref:Integrator complex subunit 11 n=4 Tax=Rhizophagus irregularis TaxID=588596 RepID=A0A2I1GDT6_9GLOM|nr:integrator complex subunit 11 [Rhizophagus irregularis DAOM 181602=DAOM 197198]EXX78534.1 Ysh1p [Rhizophagus irregularis DAOM 197198w]PKC15978.1 integrator complex subunit 11 [Rhizophagus irregularis]PKC73793.1 integrator complex subunit 11 [Rhizophagus irregularis]PKK67024.1 integrator complex subunit 11 [Rhizophagus irregularis]PKY18002.1 integrator complex subunit 11 [Rhizophagus irregularis]|eukprot:XP_025186139.1 integrator complex subunit 11 [Rhizophagus irregularis DAOM 181602=DAOM 197198]